MTLSESQRFFPPLVARLITFAYTQGYELTFGEAYRPPEMAILYAKRGTGILTSLHIDRLAIDLLLFVNACWVPDGSHPGYKVLGEYWKTLHPQCTWGGDFHTRPDANHFSFTFGGRR